MSVVEVGAEEGVPGEESLAAGVAVARDARAYRGVVGVVHSRAFPPGGPFNGAVEVEEVCPGKVVGA